jgi:hypothetical protein
MYNESQRHPPGVACVRVGLSIICGDDRDGPSGEVWIDAPSDDKQHDGVTLVLLYN